MEFGEGAHPLGGCFRVPAPRKVLLEEAPQALLLSAEPHLLQQGVAEIHGEAPQAMEFWHRSAWVQIPVWGSRARRSLVCP